MSVPEQIPVTTHTGNGVTTSFSYNFLVTLAADMAPSINGVLVSPSAFEVLGVGNPEGGSVQFTDPPPAGAAVSLQRVIALKRETDYQYAGDFQSPVVNADFDRLWMAIQSALVLIRSGVYFPPGDPTNGQLPVISERANKLLSFDAAGRLVTVAPSEQSATALQTSLALSGGAGMVGFQQAGDGAILQSLKDKARKDYLDASDFGPIVTDGSTLNTTTLNIAMIAGAALKKPVRLPPGRIATGALTWPNGLPGLFGQGAGATTLVASGTYANYTPLLNLSGKVGADLHDLDIEVDPATYALNWGVQLTNCTDVSIARLRVMKSGSAGIRGGGGNTRIDIVNCYVAEFVDLGIAFSDGAGTNEGIRVYDCDVPGSGTQTSHNIQIVGGGGHTVEKCRTTNNVAGSFGVSFYKVQGGHILSNTFSECKAEGCNLQDSSFCTIVGNSVYCAATSGDFGISIFGDPTFGANCVGNIVIGNTINTPGKSGIALANRCNNNFISGNHIYNPNRLNESMGAAVLMYGLGCNSNTAQGNFLFDSSANCRYGTNEWNDGSGLPVGNMFIDNPAFANRSDFVEWNTLSTASRVKAMRWKSYTMTVGASSGGAPSAYTVNRAEFKPDGEEIAYQFDFTITTNGTAAGSLQPTLPPGFPAISSGGVDLGQENGITGKSLNARASGGGVNVVFYDNTYPGANGARIVVSGRYRLQP